MSGAVYLRCDGYISLGGSATPGSIRIVERAAFADGNMTEFDLDTVKMLMNIFVSPFHFGNTASSSCAVSRDRVSDQ